MQDAERKHSANLSNNSRCNVFNRCVGTQRPCWLALPRHYWSRRLTIRTVRTVTGATVLLSEGKKGSDGEEG